MVEIQSDECARHGHFIRSQLKQENYALQYFLPWYIDFQEFDFIPGTVSHVHSVPVTCFICSCEL